MRLGFPLLLVAVVVAAILYFRKQRGRFERAQFLKWSGFALMALSAAFFGLFLVGETLMDPGGWKALGLVSAWGVPLATLAAIAWFRPKWAIRVLAVLIAAVIGLSIWFATDREWWRAFEDRNGPIRDVLVFVVAAAAALLGVKRTAEAGVMLLVLGTVPLAIMSLGSLVGFGSLALLTSVDVVTGVLYLLSAAMTRRALPAQPAE